MSIALSYASTKICVKRPSRRAPERRHEQHGDQLGRSCGCQPSHGACAWAWSPARSSAVRRPAPRVAAGPGVHPPREDHGPRSPAASIGPDPYCGGAPVCGEREGRNHSERGHTACPLHRGHRRAPVKITSHPTQNNALSSEMGPWNCMAGRQGDPASGFCFISTPPSLISPHQAHHHAFHLDVLRCDLQRSHGRIGRT